jgi:DNA-directed RNA polymerase subunit RPC12/RpoP
MPEYRIPKDDVIRAAIGRVFQTRHEVPSQRALKSLVEREVRGSENFRVGEERVRRLAIESGGVGLEIHTRESDEKRGLTKCPVCGERVKKLKNMTVFGGTVTLGFKCPRCGYWSGLRRRVPTRYVFRRR